MLLATADESTNLGSITMKGNLITQFVEKPEKNESSSHLVNGGVYLFDPEVCPIVTPEMPSLENDIFPKLAKGEKLFGYLLDGKWIHLHDAAKYQEFIKSKNEIK
jgi:NDP-sugar pyrophosphorylase family protein